MIVFHMSIAVGGIACRVETKNGIDKIHIMAFAVLEPYRRQGFGA